MNSRLPEKNATEPDLSGQSQAISVNLTNSPMQGYCTDTFFPDRAAVAGHLTDSTNPKTTATAILELLEYAGGDLATTPLSIDSVPANDPNDGHIKFMHACGQENEHPEDFLPATEVEKIRAELTTLRPDLQIL